MIVNLENSLYSLKGQDSDKLILKSQINGAEETWTPTEDESSVYLIRRGNQLFKYSQPADSAKTATLRAIHALTPLKQNPLLKTQVSAVTSSLLSLLAAIEEPRKLNPISIHQASGEDFYSKANELGIWEALADVPFEKQEPHQDLCSCGALRSEYETIKADFLRLAEEPDHAILGELGNGLFSCILGESELESRLSDFNQNIQAKLPEFQSRIQQLKKKVYSFMKMDPLSEVETDY